MAGATVVCYGDSNTWAYDAATGGRFTRKERWTGQLQNLLGDDVYIVEEGLNARTTVFDDPVGPSFGTYSCNGRTALAPILHSHKPIAAVVLALGTNDLKRHFAVSPKNIVSGVMALVAAIRSHYVAADGASGVKVIVCGPPRCQETPTCLDWGFEDCAARSIALTTELKVACAADSLPFVDLGAVGTVSPVDGIHYDLASQAAIAEAIGGAIRTALLD